MHFVLEILNYYVLFWLKLTFVNIFLGYVANSQLKYTEFGIELWGPRFQFFHFFTSHYYSPLFLPPFPLIKSICEILETNQPLPVITPPTILY